MLRLNYAHASMDIVFGLIAFLTLQRYDIPPKPPRKLVYKKFTFSFVSNKQFTKNLHDPTKNGSTAYCTTVFSKTLFFGNLQMFQIVKRPILYDLKQMNKKNETYFKRQTLKRRAKLTDLSRHPHDFYSSPN